MSNNIRDLAKDFMELSKNDESDKNPDLYAPARNWFIENGLLTDYEYNDIIVLTYMADKRIKDVELFVDKVKCKINHVVYLSRFAYLFKNRKKLERKVNDLIGHIVKDWEYEFFVDLYRKNKKN